MCDLSLGYDRRSSIPKNCYFSSVFDSLLEKNTMKILAISKRQYTNLDLIDDKFGRIRELPIVMSQLGHEVSGICLSYRSRKEGIYKDQKNDASVKWYSLNLKRLFHFGANSYYSALNTIIGEKKPDLIWASSDALHIILGALIAWKFKIPFVADLYDNYESFQAIRLIGGKGVFRYALKHADGITCVSHPLAGFIRKTVEFEGPVHVIENAVVQGAFYPRNKLACRRQLGLPDEGFFIGTAGAISKSRGVEVLFDAFQSLVNKEPNIRLVFAGHCDKGLELPENNRIHYLGVLPPDKVPVLLSALDIQVICNKDSTFGKYCFPQKFYEAVACQTPVVAAAVGSMPKLLEHYQDHLFEPGNARELEFVLQQRMQRPTSMHLNAATWDARGLELESFFQEILSRYK